MTFNSIIKLTYMVTAQYNTADTALAAWESTRKPLIFYVFKILPVATDDLLVVLGAAPD
jgi:hypothetical protein